MAVRAIVIRNEDEMEEVTEKKEVAIMVCAGGGVGGMVSLRLMNMYSDDLLDYDSYVGTSVGSIIAAAFATGKFSPIQVYKDFPRMCEKIFGHSSIRKPKYDLENAQKTINDYFGNLKCNDLKKRLIITSTDIVHDETKYLDAAKFADMSLGEFVSHSFCAPFYFGSIVDEDKEIVWSDGGIGYNNMPVVGGIMETLKYDRNSHFTIHAFGTGFTTPNYHEEFNKASKSRWLHQVLDYLSIKTGGFARKSSVKEEIHLGGYWAHNTGNTFIYYDGELKKIFDLDDYKGIAKPFEMNPVKITGDKETGVSYLMHSR